MTVRDEANERRTSAQLEALFEATMTITAEEFLRRFVQHVLPKGFVKVRHYGLLANRHRAEKLKQSRQLLLSALAAEGADAKASTAQDRMQVDPAPAQHCPQCGGCRFITIELPTEAEAAAGARDTS